MDSDLVSTDKIRLRADADMVSPMDEVPGVAAGFFLASLMVCLVSLKNVSSLSMSEALSELGVRAGRMLTFSSGAVTDRFLTFGVEEVERSPGSDWAAEEYFFLMGRVIEGVFNFFLAGQERRMHRNGWNAVSLEIHSTNR